MEKVRVYNDNTVTHIENFRGDEIRIPAGGYLEMPRDEAIYFKSQMVPLKKDGQGRQTLESMKKIRITPIDGEKEAQPKEIVHKCQACEQVFKSEAGLMSHIRHKHADQMIDKDAREELLNQEE